MRAWFRALDRAELVGMLVLSFVLFTGAATPLAIALSVTPEAIESGRVRLSPPCAYLARTGSPCPTCGLTRGLAALAHGQFARAERYNQNSVPLGAALFCVSLAGLALGVASARRLTTRKTAWRSRAAAAA